MHAGEKNLKVLQISTVCGSGSVGRIMVDIYHTLEKNGDIGLIAYGRKKAPKHIHAWRFGNNFDMGLHVLSTFFKGEHGFSSKRQTKQLIEKIRSWKPDVIHLHNIHGFILQVEILFDFLKQEGTPVVWTFHDCWPYTGHCAYYDYTGCDGWKTGCKNCQEYQKTYPYALFKNHTASNFLRKKKAFLGVKNLTIVTPSYWLAKEVKNSFLKEYPVQVIPNGIDLQKFHPLKSADRLRHLWGLENKFVILGVANIWERRKGLSYFLALAEKLPKDFQIILVGLNQRQRKKLPKNMIGAARTSHVEELAEIYSMADVFVNTTLEDNFPTTNLEALACGTPVITFDTGGSSESLDIHCGQVVPKKDINALVEAIKEEKQNPKKQEDCVRRAQQYEKDRRFQEYIKLYHQLAAEEKS